MEVLEELLLGIAREKEREFKGNVRASALGVSFGMGGKKANKEFQNFDRQSSFRRKRYAESTPDKLKQAWAKFEVKDGH